MTYLHALSDEEKHELCRIARATLREHCRSGRMPPGKPHRTTLLADAAATVTLRKGGQVRSRSGKSTPEQPLYLAVQEGVVAAATADPTNPVAADEIAAIIIEISIAGDPEPQVFDDSNLPR